MSAGHTPAEAGELWCPMVRTVRWETDKAVDPSFAAESGDVAHAIGGCNSGGQAARNPLSSRCIAASCAMWRWHGQAMHYIDGTVGYPERGFCGLAGVPLQVVS